jgi:DTW domain-containing protein
MNVQQYLERRQEQLSADAKKFRVQCLQCRQPIKTCYCEHVQKFDPGISFVILTHPIEARRRIATGRMAHLSLEDSFLIKGEDYTHNEKVNEILRDPNRFCVILYPGQSARDLSVMSPEARDNLFKHEKAGGKKLTVFVVDGTWATARKMARSRNLLGLPRICFTPDKPSEFKVRRQPKANCYSTIEAIHQTIEFLSSSNGELMHVFKNTVNSWYSFGYESGHKNYRKARGASRISDQ